MTAPAVTKLNLELLDQILNLIETTPSKWEQMSWLGETIIDEEQKRLLDLAQYELCGTQACVAGWAMLLSKDWKPVIEPLGDGQYNIKQMVRASDAATVSQVAEEDDMDEDNVYIKYGAQLLGLTWSQAKHIFLYMPYEQERPKTFTDRIRDYLELPTKWGATFDPEDEDSDPLTYAEGESDDDLYASY